MVFRKWLPTLPLTFALVAGAQATEVRVDINDYQVSSYAENRRNPGNSQAIAAGDFNGDGFGDLAIGSRRSAGVTTEDSGNVLIVFGHTIGFPPLNEDLFYDLTARPDAVSNGLFSQAQVEPTKAAQIFPERGGEQFGTALAAGDFNGDGADDLAVSSTNANGSGLDGSVYLVYGGPHVGGVLYLDTMIFNGEAVEFQGQTGIPNYGEVVFMDDLDGDNLAELCIGSPRATAFGYAEVVFGRDPSATPPDKQIVSRQVTTIAPWVTRMEANANGARFGSSFAAGIVDGITEKHLFVGSPRWPSPAEQKGRVTAHRFSKAITTVNVDLSPSPVTYQGVNNNQRIGEHIAVGHYLPGASATLIIGEPEANAGRGYVYLCSTVDELSTGPSLIPGAEELKFTSDTPSLSFGIGLAVANFDSVPGVDLIIGEPSWDAGGINNDVDNGRVFVLNKQPFPPNVTRPLPRNDVQGITITGFPESYEAGTSFAFTDFDGAANAGGRKDLFLSSPGVAFFDEECTGNDLTAYTTCHNARVGTRAYMIKAALLPDSGTPMNASEGWMTVP